MIKKSSAFNLKSMLTKQNQQQNDLEPAIVFL